ncbi:alpha/beta fold hydrolase [Providencia rustigianii]|uniref:Hydrolase, alpha/beta domain protein n=1 Tax=Providencia rustigianii DSM 4541 TaxID=500637 RepID=D1NYT4_9GAMM|nr:alpha/beta hydrolase [Providencia rustigianii]EFB73632.1 hydrolase, alpha/beta domain protein [Providencia rustigianii DSM 4541]SUC27042.1 2-hydroxy-6-oxo-6-phenylhexa-2,4-dienoate hydrolase [Providencia rustigianii]
MTNTAPLPLYYDSFGKPENPAVVLIPGLGGHNISWTTEFCQQIADAGFYILRPDNRDAGLSPHLSDYPSIDIAELSKKLQAGEPIDVPYTLFDMADDYIALLDNLSIEKAHIVGRSMGGFIAQIIAAKANHRVLSLCPIMSSTGNPNLPPSEPDVMQMLTSSGADPKQDLDAYLAGQIAFYRRIGSTCVPFNEEHCRNYLLQALARNYSPEGTKRQLVATVVTGDLRPHLPNVTAPTLVIHGAVDPLFPVTSGQDIFDNIQNAELEIIDGMGHDTPPELNPIIADMIISHMQGC